MLPPRYHLPVKFTGKRHYRQMSRPLYRDRQQTLMPGAVPRYPARDNLAPFIGKTFQQTIIMIIDDFDLIFTKAANALSSSVKISHFIPLYF